MKNASNQTYSVGNIGLFFVKPFTIVYINELPGRSRYVHRHAFHCFDVIMSCIPPSRDIVTPCGT